MAASIAQALVSLAILTKTSIDALPCSSTACGACNLSGKGAPSLYSVQRLDGLGGSLSNAITFMGFAESIGWNYGGALAAGNAKSWNHHNDDFDGAFEFLLGSRSATVHPRNFSAWPFNTSQPRSLLLSDLGFKGSVITSMGGRNEIRPKGGLVHRKHGNRRHRKEQFANEDGARLPKNEFIAMTRAGLRNKKKRPRDPTEVLDGAAQSRRQLKGASTRHQTPAVEWQAVKGVKGVDGLNVTFVSDHNDSLFGQRNAIIISGNFDISTVRPTMSSHLVLITQSRSTCSVRGANQEPTVLNRLVGPPYAFDVIIVEAFNPLPRKPKLLPLASTIFSQRFLDALRKGAACRVHSIVPDYFTSGSRNQEASHPLVSESDAIESGIGVPSEENLRVAIHVRRGDVDSSSSVCDHSSVQLLYHVSLDLLLCTQRYSSNAYFLRIANRIRQLYVNANVHIFRYCKDADFSPLSSSPHFILI